MKHEDYTVGWISALPIEQAAILLDEVHDKLPAKRNDTTYILGKIDVHNTVIACLPSLGIANTARCIARLENGFGSLRFVLLVGIGGGVPTVRDIRLGDVVVSMPTKKDIGVVQYDLGTKFQDEHLEIRNALIRPPSDLLVTAVAALDTRNHEPKALGHRPLKYVENFAKHAPDLESRKTDRLFSATYRHLDDRKSCEECPCDTTQLKIRPTRVDGDWPRIHKGLVASGNEVMRDARERDRLAKEKDVLCFEMEAAGLGTDLGWLAIRGICDYCDSHKNKDWQEHAAIVAAGYAKELLKIIPALEDERQDLETQEHHYKQITVNQGNISGGQANNFMGDVKTTGGKAFFGSKFRSDRDTNF